jgi:hypothetical protein
MGRRVQQPRDHHEEAAEYGNEAEDEIVGDDNKKAARSALRVCQFLALLAQRHRRPARADALSGERRDEPGLRERRSETGAAAARESGAQPGARLSGR